MNLKFNIKFTDRTALIAVVLWAILGVVIIYELYLLFGTYVSINKQFIPDKNVKVIRFDFANFDKAVVRYESGQNYEISEDRQPLPDPFANPIPREQR